MKTCSTCGDEKQLKDFYRDSRNPEVHVARCKACWALKVRERRAKNDSVREHDRRRYQTPKRKEHGVKNTRQWRLKYPEKYKAQNKLNNSLRDGKLLRPETCGGCGGASKLHAHHHDYTRPLDVVWFCARCHAQTHAAEKRVY